MHRCRSGPIQGPEAELADLDQRLARLAWRLQGAVRRLEPLAETKEENVAALEQWCGALRPRPRLRLLEGDEGT